MGLLFGIVIAFDIVRVSRLSSAFLLGFLAIALDPTVVIAQADIFAVEPGRTAAVAPTTPQAVPRRPPAPYDLHGSISGSQANPLADDPVARLFDLASERNRLGFEFYGYLD